jgi:hypothetical protein
MMNENQQYMIDLLQNKLIGMQFAHKLLTEFDNSAIDHYAREVDLIQKQILKLKMDSK